MPIKTAALAWIISAVLTARLAWSAHQHGMHALDVAAIALLSLYAAKAGAHGLIAAARNSRSKNGAAR